MIDLSTGWIKICPVPERRADKVAYQVGLAWLNRYILPIKIIVAKGKEFSVEFKIMKVNKYGIQCNSISSRSLRPIQ